MKIIAVNIGKELAKGKTELQATERAWSFDIIRDNDINLGGVQRGKYI